MARLHTAEAEGLELCAPGLARIVWMPPSHCAIADAVARQVTPISFRFSFGALFPDV
jgi:hypothetical protein